MSFKNRLVFFVFGIIIGIFLIRLIFPPTKISKIQQGYTDYFKGHDKIMNFLIYQKDLQDQVDSYLGLLKKDSLFYQDLIRNSSIEILSRKPCFQYLLKPDSLNYISELLIEKCDKKVSLISLKEKED